MPLKYLEYDLVKQEVCVSLGVTMSKHQLAFFSKDFAVTRSLSMSAKGNESAKYDLSGRGGVGDRPGIEARTVRTFSIVEDSSESVLSVKVSILLPTAVAGLECIEVGVSSLLIPTEFSLGSGRPLQTLRDCPITRGKDVAG